MTQAYTSPPLNCPQCAVVFEWDNDRLQDKSLSREERLKGSAYWCLHHHMLEEHKNHVFRCARADEGIAIDGGRAYWRADQSCSYCGSLRPENFFELVEAGSVVTPTDKNYKAYIDEQKGEATGRPDQRKVYFQHFSDEDRTRFIDLFNQKKMKMGYPGYFYNRPYFCEVKE